MIKAIIIFFIAASAAFGQLSLSNCYELADSNYPLAKATALQQDVTAMQLELLDTKYLPEISFYGKAQYQSDVPTIAVDAPIPGLSFPEIPRDQYNVGLNINQVIWDGGIISSKKSQELVNSARERNSIDIQLFGLHRKIDELFFGIIYLREKRKSLNLLQATLEEKFKVVNSAVVNGVALSGDLDVLKVEILRIEQNRASMESQQLALIQSLSEIIGKEIAFDEDLFLPELDVSASGSLMLRPEYDRFKLGIENLDAYADLTDAKYMPKINAFANAGYARPGYDIFNPDFQAIYMVGIRANWNIWNWNASDKEIESIEVQKKILKVRRNTFTKNLKIAEKKYLNEITNLEKVLDSDLQIIRIRKGITEQASSKYSNGTITISDFVSKVNSESEANLNYEYNKIRLIKAKLNYLTLFGKEDY